MTSMQIQLPEQLYNKAAKFAAEKHISFTEMAQQGLELMIEHYAEKKTSKESSWSLPLVDGGGIKVSLNQLNEIAAEDELARG